MEYRERIDAVEARAQVINLTLHAICRRAGVNASNVLRWRSGAVSPTERTLSRDVTALEVAVAEAEQDVLDRLAGAQSSCGGACVTAARS